MSPGDWAAAASAVIAFLSMIGAGIGWFLSRRERKKATRQAEEAKKQANLATQASVDAAAALKQIADVQEESSQRDQARAAAEERDPWRLERYRRSGPYEDARIHNETDTAKHHVAVAILANDQPYGDIQAIGYVGPRRPAEIDFFAIDAQMSMRITWHLKEDQSDHELVQIIRW